MNKSLTAQVEYPINLMLDIDQKLTPRNIRCEATAVEPYRVSWEALIDKEESLSYVLKFLSEEQRAAIQLRYEFGFSMQEVAEKLNVTHYRATSEVRAALETLRRPRLRGILRSGIGGYLDRVCTHVAALEDAAQRYELRQQGTRIEILDLSVRVHRALLRSNIDTIQKLLMLSPEALMLRVDSLGKKGCKEIQDRLKVFGLVLRTDSAAMPTYSLTESLRSDLIEGLNKVAPTADVEDYLQGVDILIRVAATFLHELENNHMMHIPCAVGDTLYKVCTVDKAPIPLKHNCGRCDFRGSECSQIGLRRLSAGVEDVVTPVVIGSLSKLISILPYLGTVWFLTEEDAQKYIADSRQISR